ncbi:hypothetical protein QCN29_06225 [Streptomyces sp. HNM0663]|uniref:Uncharacterized protein n=1 Tax=Streptomyces chengmaiensis TaxID=3040919 RepID=A0ABT6HHZ4_9ACTN|nr:hypothetical protein [Streptomyces chengmaiensis]MDH2388387.1 hypothetical protein [Streptomyces chengmaiensis]
MPKSAHYIATRGNLYKPELKPEILAFIREKRAVHSADITRKFFPARDTNQTSRYLRSMESQGLILSTRRGKYLWWSPAGVEVTEEELAARTPKRLTEEERQASRERRTERQRERRREERAKRPTPERPPRVTKTKEELRAAKNERTRRRRAERKEEEALLEIAELEAVEQWLNQVEQVSAQKSQTLAPLPAPPDMEREEPEGMAGIRERQTIRRQKSVERLKAEGKFYGWRKQSGYDRMGGGPSVYSLANYIHVRMKNDREYKGWYRFTYEWVRLHYPHLLANYRDLVEDALELLVIQGKIERLDYPVKVTVSGGES